MPDHEPENYSIDEMMQRLRTRSEESVGEDPIMVTRPDGTQVVKVRRRKRRSKQPHKEAEKKRRRRTLMVVSMITAVAIVVGLGMVGWLFYLNGRDYREQVIERIKQWTGADVQVVAFRATPVNAAADYLELNWPEDCPVAKLRVHHLRADLMLSSHVTDTWSGRQIAGSSGELILRHAASGEPLARPSGPMPFEVPMRVDSLNVLFGDGERKAFGLYKSEATMDIANPDSPEPTVVLQNGTCRIGKWGPFRVKYASVKLGHQGTSLGTLQLSPESDIDAELVLSSDGLPPIPVRGGSAEFSLKMREMPSLVLLGTGLGSLIEGTFESPDEDSSGRAYLDVTQVDSLRINCPLRGSHASVLKLYRFQMFDVLSQTLNSPRLTQPRFDTASSMRIERDFRQVFLSEINLEAEGTIRLRGELREGQSGSLGGTLEVGLAESMVALSTSRALKAVFHRSEDEYLWATVKLSGTSKAPTDDLSAQLKSALEAEAPGEAGLRGLDKEFEELTSPEN